MREHAFESISPNSATNPMRRFLPKTPSLKAEMVKATFHECACYMETAFRRLRESAHWTHKTVSYKAVLEMTNCGCVEMAIGKRQLWSTGTLFLLYRIRVSKHIMFGILVARGSAGHL